MTTKAHIAAMHKLTGRLEALQRAHGSGPAAEELARAKNAMIEALRKAEAAHARRSV